MKFERYDSYKDSKLNLDNTIPSCWNDFRVDWISKVIRGNTGFKKDELLNNGKYVALQYGKTYQNNEINETFKFYVNDEFYKSSQVVSIGDTIVISTSETLEDLGHTCFYSRNDLGLIGGEQILLKPNIEYIFGKYLFYSSKVFSDKLKKYATGLKVFRFNTNDLKNIFISLPSVKKQKIIVNFIDTKTQKIDNEISLLEQKIKKYQELKQTLINETVLRGLDKNVKLKESGIEWIGEIPEGWEIKRLKDNVTCLNGGAFKDGLVDKGLPIIKIQQLVSNKQATEFCRPDFFKINSGNKIKSGDLLFSWSTLLQPFIYKGKNALLNQHIFKLKYSQNINKMYLYYLLMVAKNHLLQFAHGSTMKHILKSDLDNLIYFSPKLNEQEEIANYLDEKTQKIDTISETIENKIVTLKEFRKTLINDAVTGKIKVAS